MVNYTYYKTRGEAEEKRKKGERIYYEPMQGWYIVKKEKSFFDRIRLR